MEKTVAFREVDYVDPDCLEKITGVFHSEVEPLQVARSICVIAHEHVERGGVLYPDLVEIRTLKVCIECDLRTSVRIQGYLLTCGICDVRSGRTSIH